MRTNKYELLTVKASQWSLCKGCAFHSVGEACPTKVGGALRCTTDIEYPAGYRAIFVKMPSKRKLLQRLYNEVTTGTATPSAETLAMVRKELYGK